MSELILKFNPDCQSHDILELLTQDARGQFPALESFFRAQNIHLPVEWNIHDAMKLSSICAGFVLLDGALPEGLKDDIRDIKFQICMDENHPGFLEFSYSYHGDDIKGFSPLPGNMHYFEPGIPILIESQERHLIRTHFINLKTGELRENFQEVLRCAVGDKQS